jgi:hypothetical protein
LKIRDRRRETSPAAASDQAVSLFHHESDLSGNIDSLDSRRERFRTSRPSQTSGLCNVRMCGG